MAMAFGIPKTDNLLCSNVLCTEKATCVVHRKDNVKLFFCREHFPLDLVRQPHVMRVETLQRPGEWNPADKASA